MDLIQLLIILIVVGVIMWLVNNYLPLDQPFKTIINVVVVIVLLIWILGLFGIGNYHIGIPRR